MLNGGLKPVEKKDVNKHFPVKIFLDHESKEENVISYITFNELIPDKNDYVLKFREKKFEVKIGDIMEDLKKSQNFRRIREVENGIWRLNILVVSKVLIKVLARCEIYRKSNLNLKYFPKSNPEEFFQNFSKKKSYLKRSTDNI